MVETLSTMPIFAEKEVKRSYLHPPTHHHYNVDHLPPLPEAPTAPVNPPNIGAVEEREDVKKKN